MKWVMDTLKIPHGEFRSMEWSFRGRDFNRARVLLPVCSSLDPKRQG